MNSPHLHISQAKKMKAFFSHVKTADFIYKEDR